MGEGSGDGRGGREGVDGAALIRYAGENWQVITPGEEAEMEELGRASD